MKNQKYILIGAGLLFIILVILLVTRRETYTCESNKQICGQFICSNDSDCSSAGGYCDKSTGFCCLPDRTAQQCDARAQQIYSKTNSFPNSVNSIDCCPGDWPTFRNDVVGKSLIRSDLPSDTFLCLNAPLMSKDPASPLDKLYIPVKWGGKCCPCPVSSAWCLDNQ